MLINAHLQKRIVPWFLINWTDGASKDGSGFSMDSWTAFHTNWIFGLSLDLVVFHWILQAFHKVGRIFIGLVFSKQWIGFHWIWTLVLAWSRGLLSVLLCVLMT
jgi:hypothetical protein